MNEVMNAIVNLTVCPKRNGSKECCSKCFYRAFTETCHEHLAKSSLKVLEEHFMRQEPYIPHEPVKISTPNYRMILSDIFRDIGIPANILGYEYLRRAVILTIYDYEHAQQATKWLYPTIAAEFNTTAARVERGIRHAITVAFEHGDYDALIDYFGNTINIKSGKLKNTEFIFGIADHIKLKYSIE